TGAHERPHETYSQHQTGERERSECEHLEDGATHVPHPHDYVTRKGGEDYAHRGAHHGKEDAVVERAHGQPVAKHRLPVREREHTERPVSRRHHVWDE